MKPAPGPDIHALMAAAEGARLLTHEQLLGLGAVARHPEAWSGLLEVHARHGPTLTTRIAEAQFWVLPEGPSLQEVAGQPVYMDDQGGMWILQIAQDGSLYRRRIDG
jgi:hypothetical protein